VLCQIINWKTCLKFPAEPTISAEAKDLICRLMCDVDARLGTRGVEEIKVIKGSFRLGIYNHGPMIVRYEE